MTFRAINKGLVALVVVLALTLGSFVTPALASSSSAAGQCGDAGGLWITEDVSISDGICLVEEPGLCPGFAYVAIVYISDIPAFLGCKDTIDLDENEHFAFYGSLGQICIQEGGIWTGDLIGENGTCTFLVGHEIALDDCGPGFTSIYTVVDNDITGDPACVADGVGSSGGGGADYPPYGRFGNVVHSDSGAGSLSLGGPKNGSVSFDAGTCVGKCTVSPNLPGGAHASLPDDVLATLYFRSTDADGEPGTGTYTVCFAVGDLTNPVIYRYIGGAWVAQSVTISGGQVCTTGSGDGAYALGGS